MSTHKALTKQRILREATKLFAKKGFDGASMADIATHAGIEKASLYYFYRDKEEIFCDVLERIWGGLARRLPDLRPGKPAKREFTEYLTYVLKANLKAGLLALRLKPATFPTSRHLPAHQYVEKMRKRLREFLEKSRLPHPRAAEALIVNAVHGYVIQSHIRPPAVPPDEYIKYLASLIL